MKIYRCDKCGIEHALKQIVGTEFDTHGFQTLAKPYQFGNVIDVCAKCYKEIVAAKFAGEEAARGVQRKTFLQRLGVTS